MPLIRKDLTYGIFDWAVTDAEAHEVLEILKRLPEADLADTVAAMEKDGLVQRLFENVSDADQFAYADTVQRIQNLRVHAAKTGPSTVGSCSPKELKTAEDKIDAIKDLARQAKNSVNDFISERDKHPNTATLLDKNFFHNSRNPPGLVPAQQKLKAQQIATNLESVEKQVNPFPIQCASPIDIECTTIAAAYVSDTGFGTNGNATAGSGWTIQQNAGGGNADEAITEPVDHIKERVHMAQKTPRLRQPVGGVEGAG